MSRVRHGVLFGEQYTCASAAPSQAAHSPSERVCIISTLLLASMNESSSENQSVVGIKGSLSSSSELSTEAVEGLDGLCCCDGEPESAGEFRTLDAARFKQQKAKMLLLMRC
jgi:hypothetical protein